MSATFNAKIITDISPMSATTLMKCLAGELDTLPALLVEAIQEDPDTLALVRQYGKGLATYEEVREAVSHIV